MIEFLRKNVWASVGIGVLSLGVLGAGLKYLEEDAKRVSSLTVREGSLLNSINPFLSSPSPTPTPQLSKEYIYAGSRLLAVEDGGASAAPPADLAVWRPTTGTWFVLGGPGSAQTQHNWGAATDKPVQGDFDGDGKTDFTVFRPTDGIWYIVNSSTGTLSYVNFGLSTDTPMAADFDGDGRSDQAVFRADNSTGNATWFINQSSGAGVISQPFGLNADKPAPADFDGDGRADINVWRDSNYTFYTLFSTTNAVGSVVLGSSAGQPVPADYDGDGKANYAVKVGNVWAILNSNYTPMSPVTWHDASDTAVQNDYDGDGIVDIAVWRPVESQTGAGDLGVWYIRQSSKLGITGQSPTTANPHPNELRTNQWGTTADIPVPAFYRR
mgnify:CR=1 FL=1